MLRRKSDPTKVDIKLFYEFAKTVLQDIESLEVEIKRLKKDRAPKQ